MADFLLEIGLEEVPARMIAGAEAELGKRVSDLLTRERLLGARREGDDLLHAAAAGGAGGGRAGQAGRHRRAVDRARRGRSRSKTARRRRRPRPLRRRRAWPLRRSKKLTTPKGEYVGATVKRTGPHGGGAAGRRVAEGSAGALLGQEHVLARGQAGAVCAAGALGCGAARFGGCSAGDCGDCGGQCEPRTSRAAWRPLRGYCLRPKSYAETLRAANVVVDVAERRQIDSQGAGRGDAHGCRRALARGRGAG